MTRVTTNVVGEVEALSSSMHALALSAPAELEADALAGAHSGAVSVSPPRPSVPFGAEAHADAAELATAIDEYYARRDPLRVSCQALLNRSDLLAESPLPVGMLLAPFAAVQPPPPRVQHRDLMCCDHCGAAFNLYCDARDNSWRCCFCHHDNARCAAGQAAQPRSSRPLCCVHSDETLTFGHLGSFPVRCLAVRAPTAAGACSRVPRSCTCAPLRALSSSYRRPRLASSILLPLRRPKQRAALSARCRRRSTISPPPSCTPPALPDAQAIAVS